jgi:hypothetical protein
MRGFRVLQAQLKCNFGVVKFNNDFNYRIMRYDNEPYETPLVKRRAKKPFFSVRDVRFCQDGGFLMRIVLTDRENREVEQLLKERPLDAESWEGLSREQIVNLIMFQTASDEHEANAIFEHSQESLNAPN